MIDTKSLRSKILELALRGNLTKQLPEDGTAEELYCRIQEEKKRLIAEKKIKREKQSLSVETETKPYIIPNHWMWVRLSDICSKIVDGDHNPPAGVKEHTEYLMLSASNIMNDQLYDLTKCRYLSKEVFEEENKRTHLEVNDVLLTIVGTIGRTCVYRGGHNICFQRSVSVITPMIDSMFLKYVLDDSYYQKYMTDNATGTAQKGFYLDKVSNLVVPLPPIEEQRRIVSVINDAFALIETIEANQKLYESNKESLKAAIIDLGIAGRLTEQLPEDGNAEDLCGQIQKEKKKLITEKKIKKEKPLPDIDNGNIHELPANWRWVRLGDIVSVFGGKRIPAGRSLCEENTGHKYIRVSEMKNFSVNTDTIRYVPEDIYPSISRYIINSSDVYITVAGTIGRVGVVPDELDGANLTENADRLVFSLLNKHWLMYCLSSDFVQKQINMVTTQVAQPKLSIRRIEELIIPLPPIAEQFRIVEIIKQMYNILLG